MDTISFNPERYQIEITNMMDKFFNDSILSFNPYEKDELFITNFIRENILIFFDEVSYKKFVLLIRIKT